LVVAALSCEIPIRARQCQAGTYAYVGVFISLVAVGLIAAMTFAAVPWWYAAPAFTVIVTAVIATGILLAMEFNPFADR